MRVRDGSGSLTRQYRTMEGTHMPDNPNDPAEKRRNAIMSHMKQDDSPGKQVVGHASPVSLPYEPLPESVSDRETQTLRTIVQEAISPILDKIESVQRSGAQADGLSQTDPRRSIVDCTDIQTAPSYQRPDRQVLYIDAPDGPYQFLLSPDQVAQLVDNLSSASQTRDRTAE